MHRPRQEVEREIIERQQVANTTETPGTTNNDDIYAG